MGRPMSSWEELYRTSQVSKLPWFAADLDRDLHRALKRFGPFRGVLLDLGTGPGTHAVGLAKLGYEVVATDIAASAIRAARAYADEAGATIDFQVDDILHSKLKDGRFDGAIDRGVFHTLSPPDRKTYVTTLRRILRPRGWLHLKCFSDKEPGNWGPYRISRKALRASFRDGFDVVSLRDTVFQGNVRPYPRALIATFQRR